MSRINGNEIIYDKIFHLIMIDVIQAISLWIFGTERSRFEHWHYGNGTGATENTDHV